jgi:hypothetical protein
MPHMTHPPQLFLEYYTTITCHNTDMKVIITTITESLESHPCETIWCRDVSRDEKLPYCVDQLHVICFSRSDQMSCTIYIYDHCDTIYLECRRSTGDSMLFVRLYRYLKCKFELGKEPIVPQLCNPGDIIGTTEIVGASINYMNSEFTDRKLIGLQIMAACTYTSSIAFIWQLHHPDWLSCLRDMISIPDIVTQRWSLLCLYYLCVPRLYPSQYSQIMEITTTVTLNYDINDHDKQMTYKSAVHQLALLSDLTRVSSALNLRFKLELQQFTDSTDA